MELTFRVCYHKILPMKVFLTGGTGFIGSHIAERLWEKGYELYALVRDPNNLKWLEGLDIHILKGDLFNIPKLPSDIQYIIHSAGSTKSCHLAQYYTVNQLGTASLFQAVEEQGLKPKRIVHLSSIAASGPCRNGIPVAEDFTPCPVTVYGKSKYLGEAEALKVKEKFPLVILRLSAVFGPRDTDFFHYFKFIHKGILPAAGTQSRFVSLCYIKDLVRAVLLSMEKDLSSGEIMNIADPTPYTWDELGRTAGAILGKKLKLIRVPLFVSYSFALFCELQSRITGKSNIISLDKFKDMKETSFVVDTAKSERLLDFRTSYSLKEGLKETLRWYVKKGWL